MASGYVGVRQVNFVDDRNDQQVLLHRQVDIGDGLRFDALRRVNDEQRALAGAQAAGDFVREIHVAGGVDQVELVNLAVLRLVTHRDRMGLDGDATLAFQVHGIEQLRLHVAGGDGAGAVQQAVGKRRLPMVNMGDDAEISDVIQRPSFKLSVSQCNRNFGLYQKYRRKDSGVRSEEKKKFRRMRMASSLIGSAVSIDRGAKVR